MSKIAGKRECPTTAGTNNDDDGGGGGNGGSRTKKSGSSSAAALLLPPIASHAAAPGSAAGAGDGIANSSSDLLDPLQWLGEDLHRLILGYVMCLPPRVERPKPYQDAFSLYADANRKRIKEGEPENASSSDIQRLTRIEYEALPTEERARWYELSQKDVERVKNEMAAYRSIIGRPKPNQSPFLLFSDANRPRVEEAHPDAGFRLIGRLVLLDFKALTTEERARWDKLAQKDKERYIKEMHEQRKIFESPKRLAETCDNLSFVSRSWRDVADDVMNQRAPKEVMAPSDLANLKRRAASLDLSSVQNTFGERIAEYDYRGPLLPLDRSEEETALEMIIAAAAVKFRKFLVVRSVEIVASKAKVEDEADEKSVRAIEAWKARSRQPSQLVDWFWNAHMSYPEQYERDCQALIGCAMSAKIEDGQDGQGGTDYERKEQELFHFEGQFSLGYVRPDSVKTKALFHDSFDLSEYPPDSDAGSDFSYDSDFGF